VESSPRTFSSPREMDSERLIQALSEKGARRTGGGGRVVPSEERLSIRTPDRPQSQPPVYAYESLTSVPGAYAKPADNIETDYAAFRKPQSSGIYGLLPSDAPTRSYLTPESKQTHRFIAELNLRPQTAHEIESLLISTQQGDPIERERVRALEEARRTLGLPAASAQNSSMQDGSVDGLMPSDPPSSGGVHQSIRSPHRSRGMRRAPDPFAPLPGMPDSSRGHGPLSDDEARVMFDMVDLDSDGLITLAQLSRALFHSPDVSARLLSTRLPAIVDFIKKLHVSGAPVLSGPPLRLHDFVTLVQNRSGEWSSDAANAMGHLGYLNLRAMDESPLAGSSLAGSILDASLADKRSVLSYLRGVPIQSIPGSLATGGPRPEEGGEDVDGKGEFRNLIAKIQDLTTQLQTRLSKEQRMEGHIRTLEAALHITESTKEKEVGEIDYKLKHTTMELQGHWECERERLEQIHARELREQKDKQEAILVQAAHMHAQEIEAIQRDTQPTIFGLRKQEAEHVSEIASLQQSLDETTARYDGEVAWRSELQGNNAEQGQLNAGANTRIAAQEEEILEQREELASLENKKKELVDRCVVLDESQEGNVRRIEELEGESAGQKRALGQAHQRIQDLSDALNEASELMNLKDQGLRLALQQSKNAIDTRNEVTVRLNGAISEATVQKSICVAAAGVLHLDGVDSIMTALGGPADEADFDGGELEAILEAKPSRTVAMAPPADEEEEDLMGGDFSDLLGGPGESRTGSTQRRYEGALTSGDDLGSAATDGLADDISDAVSRTGSEGAFVFEDASRGASKHVLEPPPKSKSGRTFGAFQVPFKPYA